MSNFIWWNISAYIESDCVWPPAGGSFPSLIMNRPKAVPQSSLSSMRKGRRLHQELHMFKQAALVELVPLQRSEVAVNTTYRNSAAVLQPHLRPLRCSLMLNTNLFFQTRATRTWGNRQQLQCNNNNLPCSTNLTSRLHRIWWWRAKHTV